MVAVAGSADELFLQFITSVSVRWPYGAPSCRSVAEL
jgi:hypothetical protein